MQRIFILLKRKPGISFEQFREHYETSHAVLGNRYFGHLFSLYRRNYIPSGMRFSDRTMVENAYDCITEIEFRDAEGHAEMRRIVADPEIQRTLIEDEARFLDRANCLNVTPEPIETDVAKRAPLIA